MKNVRISTRGGARFLSGAAVLCAAVLVSGCVGSPTYGTGKSANQQLLEDVSGALSLAPTNRGAEIDYNTPRPELVKPASTETLPEPQQQVVSSDNPAWPESPEERRARIRAEATANQDNPRYRGQVATGPNSGNWSQASLSQQRGGAPDALSSAQQRAEFQRRLRENRQGAPNTRRYLSEPPLDYRRPAETAAVGELGEDEAVKERRMRDAAGGKKGLRDWLPW